MTDAETLTICVKCVHHRGKKDAVWHGHHCTHPELAREQGVDFVTGAKCFWARNDLGLVYAGDKRHPHCRSINDRGECDFYESEVMDDRR